MSEEDSSSSNSSTSQDQDSVSVATAPIANNDPQADETDPDEAEERRREEAEEAARIAAEEAAMREAERKARKRQSIGILEAASGNPFFQSLIQEEDQITDDIEDNINNGLRDFDDQVISPGDFHKSMQTGRLQYMKRCTELNMPPSSKFLRQLASGDVINMSHFGLGPDGTLAIADCISVNSTITKLDLSDNEIGDSGAFALALALETNSTITSLNLYKNHMSALSIARLLQPIYANKSLQELSLRHTKVNDEVIELLSEMMMKDLKITKLDLAQNEITEAGMVHFCTLLDSGHSLTELDLSWNQLRDAGGKAIAKSLAANSGQRGLKRLSLAFTGFGSEAGVAWAAVLNRSGCDSLQWLDLSNNRFDAIAGEALAPSIQENETLKHLDISGNPFGAATPVVLAALEANKYLVSYKVSTQGRLVEEDRSEPNAKLAPLAAAKSRVNFY